MSNGEYEKLSMAEFKGRTLATLDAIQKQIKDHKKDTDKEMGEVKVKANLDSKRIKSLEIFQANVVGKFTVIGAVVILATNLLWDFAQQFLSKLKIK